MEHVNGSILSYSPQPISSAARFAYALDCPPPPFTAYGFAEHHLACRALSHGLRQERGHVEGTYITPCAKSPRPASFFLPGAYGKRRRRANHGLLTFDSLAGPTPTHCRALPRQ